MSASSEPGGLSREALRAIFDSIREFSTDPTTLESIERVEALWRQQDEEAGH